jgi:proteic killer suppression protein
MIVSFGDKGTEDFYNGEETKDSRRIPANIQAVAFRKLVMLNNTHELCDLRIPPANRLEALRGDLAGRHSIRINDQWRVVFTWNGGNAVGVAIVDYH